MITLTRMEVWKMLGAIEDSITEYDRTAVRSSPEYAETCKSRASELYLIKLKLREVLDYNSKRIAVE